MYALLVHGVPRSTQLRRKNTQKVITLQGSLCNTNRAHMLSYGGPVAL